MTISHIKNIIQHVYLVVTFELGRKTKETPHGLLQCSLPFKNNLSKFNQLVSEIGIIDKNYNPLQIVLIS